MNRGILTSTFTCVVSFVALTQMTGCSTVATGDTVASAAATTAFSPKPPKSGFGVAYVGRPMTSHTSIFAVPIELDGKPLASLGADKYIRVELAPGHHQIGAADDTWSRAINGSPHPADLTVEPGKVYYLLPTRWAGNSSTTITMVGGMAIPEQTAQAHSSFSVQVSTPGAPPPPGFLDLAPGETQS
jgi:hypothetical protein